MQKNTTLKIQKIYIKKGNEKRKDEEILKIKMKQQNRKSRQKHKQ